MSANATELEKRLTPTHLIPETEEELMEEMRDTEKKISEPEQEDPKQNKEYTFNFKYVDGNGKSWEGKFTNKILSYRDRQIVGVTRSRLCGGQPYDSMDPLTNELNMIIAHLTQSLIVRPAWAKNLLSLTNYEIIQELYMEVDSHESHFHGRKSLEEISQSQSG